MNHIVSVSNLFLKAGSGLVFQNLYAFQFFYVDTVKGCCQMLKSCLSFDDPHIFVSAAQFHQNSAHSVTA